MPAARLRHWSRVSIPTWESTLETVYFKGRLAGRPKVFRDQRRINAGALNHLITRDGIKKKIVTETCEMLPNSTNQGLSNSCHDTGVNVTRYT